MNDFEGRRALVTGATSGIGRATARLLHGRGATVLATGRKPDALAFAAGGDRWIPLAGDLTDAAFRERLVAEARGRWGALDVLVNAAGIYTGGTWESTDLAALDAMLDLNVRALYDLTRRAIPLLRAARGTVVNVSSVAGTRAFPNLLAYCVSKAGVDQLTRCLAMELAPDGVRVNAVNPGVVRTELHLRGGMEADRYAEFLERSRTTHPLGRVGTPDEVAELIAFLASERAGWITGDTVAIDGGRAETCAR